jgi:Icc-related predicted phosphoesterase
MVIGALADVHGNFAAMTRAMARHPEVPLWLCVGDLASRTGAYPDSPAPLYWIKGNNEDFDRIAAWESGAAAPCNLHFIRNGTAVDAGPLRVAGLGGTFAPTWFDTPAAQLPAKRSDDKRRHFVREEVEACKQLSKIDILMTHEAARPFVLVDDPAPDEASDRDAAGARDSFVLRAPARRKPRRIDAGKPAINEVLAAMQPRLHLCGHHHRFAETRREGVPSVCIDRINRCYLLIDADTLAYTCVDTDTGAVNSTP